MKQEIIRLNVAVHQFHHKFSRKIDLIERALSDNNPYKEFLRKKVAREIDFEFERILWKCHARLYKNGIIRSMLLSMSTTDLYNFFDIV